MAKRTKTDKLKVTMAQRITRFKEGCLAAFRVTVRATYVGLWVAMAGGTIYGLSWCREHTLNLPQYKKPVAVKLEQVPSWLQQPGHRYIRDAILSSVTLNPSEDCFSSDAITSKVAHDLSSCKWVQEVVRVRKDDRDGVVWVQCTYSLPTAWIQQRDKCYLIDDRGVRLPGIYASSHIVGSKMPIVSGVAAEPPEVGLPWSGEDLQAGIRQATVLPAHIREQIASIDVSNYMGRKNPQAPDIKLITQERASEIYWGHAPGEEYEVELAADSKVKVLEDNLRRYGRIDGNRAYLDIRTAPAFQPSPRSATDDAGMRAMARADQP